uniref:Uncharacterized protein n=1 Tax=Parascaris univalens TaxID=6257 RepID=A0A915A0V1_PARUN
MGLIDRLKATSLELISFCSRGSEEPCDLKLSREVPRLLMLSVNRLPACYYGHVEHYSLGEAPSGHAIYKSQRVIKQSSKFDVCWCSQHQGLFSIST